MVKRKIYFVCELKNLNGFIYHLDILVKFRIDELESKVISKKDLLYVLR